MNAPTNTDRPGVRAQTSTRQTSSHIDHQAPLVKYQLVEPSAHVPWHALMRNPVGELVGTDDLDDLVLDLLTGSLAPTTYLNFGTGMRRCTVF
jgi:hypothetical protein